MRKINILKDRVRILTSLYEFSKIAWEESNRFKKSFIDYKCIKPAYKATYIYIVNQRGGLTIRKGK